MSERHTQRCWKVVGGAHGPAQLVGLGGWALSCCRDSVPTDSRQTLVKRMRFVPRGELISQASIAARTILIGPLYGQLLKENKNPSGNKRVKKFFMMNFFLTFSIMHQNNFSSRI